MNNIKDYPIGYHLIMYVQYMVSGSLCEYCSIRGGQRTIEPATYATFA